MKNKKIFTLVELIVVIAILAVLSVVSFLYLTNWISKSRDSRRLSDINNIFKALQVSVYYLRNYPMPDNYIEIKNGSNVIMYQGEVGSGVASKVDELTKIPRDPLDNTLYTYSIDSKREKYYSVMAMLENSGYAISMIDKVNAQSVDYNNRYPVQIGNYANLLSLDNVPLEKLGITNIDLLSNNNTFKAVYDGNKIYIGTSEGIYILLYKLSSNKIYKNCKEILDAGESKGNGYYIISPDGTNGIKVYCDMTIDGGGWTRYVAIKGNYSFQDAKDCVLSGYIINNSTLFCMDPRKYLGLGIGSGILIKNGSNYEIYFVKGYTDYISDVISYWKRDVFDYMYGSTNGEEYVRLGLHRDSNSHGEQPGGSGVIGYMNGCSTRSNPKNRPILSSMSTTAEKFEFYVR